MKINTVSNINFKAKNPQTRKADDIMRKSRQVFPVYSPYAHTQIAYNLDGNKKMSVLDLLLFVRKTRKHTKYNNKAYKKIEESRAQADVYANNYVARIECVLRKMKQSKLGNCGEIAKAALVALYANKYYTSTLVSPILKAELVEKNRSQKAQLQENKDAQKSTMEARKNIDHTLVFTRIDGKNIIIDPTHYICKDLTKINELFETGIFAKQTKLLKMELALKLAKSYPQKIKDPNYEIRYKIVPSYEVPYRQNIIELSKLAREKYPELIV